MLAADAKKGTMLDSYKRALRKMRLSQRFESVNATFQDSSNNGWNQKKEIESKLSSLKKNSRWYVNTFR